MSQDLTCQTQNSFSSSTAQNEDSPYLLVEEPSDSSSPTATTVVATTVTSSSSSSTSSAPLPFQRGRYVGWLKSYSKYQPDETILLIDIRDVKTASVDNLTVEGFIERVGVYSGRLAGDIDLLARRFVFRVMEILEGEFMYKDTFRYYPVQFEGFISEDTESLSGSWRIDDIKSDFKMTLALDPDAGAKSRVSSPAESRLFAASPRTLRITQLYPNDAVTQQLLTATIGVAAEVSSKYFLTPNAAVLLAVCNVRLAGYLLAITIKSGASTIDPALEPVYLARLFSEVRQCALAQMQLSGWAAASRFPKEVLERWWKLAKELLPSESTVSSVLDNETEQAVCSAFLAEWTRQLLNTMIQLAVSLGTDLLTADILEMAMLNSNDCVACVFRQLNCAVIVPSLDALQAFELVEPREHTRGYLSCKKPQDPWGVDHWSGWLAVHVMLPTPMAKLESARIGPILPAGVDDHWYDRPHLIQRVAEELARGQREIHVSDRVFAENGIRPSSYRLIQHSQCRPGGTMTPFKSEVELSVTDAAEREWRLVLKFDQTIAQLVRPGDYRDTVVVLMNFKRKHTDFCSTRSNYLVDEIWTQFTPRLSDQQRQTLTHVKAALTHLEQAVKLENNYKLYRAKQRFSFQHTGSSQSPGFPSHVLAEYEEYKPVEDDDNSSRIRPLSPDLASSTEALEKKLWDDWRLQSFRQIASLSFPLLAYDRWGPTRYVAKYPEIVCRNFQSSLIDAVMKMDGLPLLPTVLLDIIAEYHTLESIPYLCPEDQKQLESDTSASSSSSS